MCEVEKDSEYYSIQHFISESPWCHRAVMDQTAKNVSNQLSSLKKPVGLFIDESGHAKKGKVSVGVSRQYSGTLGKVDNCQVAVYCGLSCENYYGLIDASLYLSTEWTSDKQRCEKAGIPFENRVYKTKLVLALEMITHQIEIGTKFDYVAGDGLYGNNYALIEALDKKGITAIFDIHKDQHIYTEPPVLFVPVQKSHKGRKTSRIKTESKAITVKDFHNSIDAKLFQEVVIRQSTKGLLKSQAYYQSVFTWDGVSANYQKRTLLIRCTEDTVKYALSNAEPSAYSLEEMVKMQAQRYYIERSFQENKQDIGMSEYQVRGWLAWHHHIALCMMAQGYILQEKMNAKDEYPLLSAYDVRQVIMNTFIRKNDNYDVIETQIRARHKKRDTDIKRRNLNST